MISTIKHDLDMFYDLISSALEGRDCDCRHDLTDAQKKIVEVFETVSENTGDIEYAPDSIASQVARIFHLTVTAFASTESILTSFSLPVQASLNGKTDYDTSDDSRSDLYEIALDWLQSVAACNPRYEGVPRTLLLRMCSNLLAMLDSVDDSLIDGEARDHEALADTCERAFAYYIDSILAETEIVMKLLHTNETPMKTPEANPLSRAYNQAFHDQDLEFQDKVLMAAAADLGILFKEIVNSHEEVAKQMAPGIKKPSSFLN